MNRKNVRKYPRISAAFPVKYDAGKETLRTRATTLGGGGLFLGIVKPLDPATEINIRFRPEKHLPIIRAKAKVCYQVPNQGTAIEFIEISPENRKAILRLIHRKTADKRIFPRAPLATQIQCEECMSLAFSRDVSMGGMFIETKEPNPVGSRISLRFNLDDGGPIVIVVAEVLYEVEKLGMGVQFSEIGAADRKRIVVYVSNSQIAPSSTRGTRPAS